MFMKSSVAVNVANIVQTAITWPYIDAFIVEKDRLSVKFATSDLRSLVILPDTAFYTAM